MVLKKKFIVVNVMMKIFISLMCCISMVWLYLLVSCLVSVENRKNGRMNNVRVMLLRVFILVLVIILEVISRISVWWKMLLLKVFRNWVKKKGLKWCFISSEKILVFMVFFCVVGYCFGEWVFLVGG